MITYYHASREFVEHPSLLLDALGDLGVVFQSKMMLRSFGSLAGVDFYLAIHPKRFCGNVSVMVKWTPKKLPKTIDEVSIREYLDAVKAERASMSAFETRMTEILAGLDINVVESRADAECDFVDQQFVSTPKTTELIQAIREQQLLIRAAVNAQDFELASKHCSKRDQLLDELYDFCSAGFYL